MAEEYKASISRTLNSILFAIIAIGFVLMFGLGYYALQRIVTQEADAGLRKVAVIRANAIADHLLKPANELKEFLQSDQEGVYEMLISPSTGIVASGNSNSQQHQGVLTLTEQITEYPAVIKDPEDGFFYGVVNVGDSGWIYVRAFPGDLISTRMSNILWIPLGGMLLFFIAAALFLRRSIDNLVLTPVSHINRAIDSISEGDANEIPVQGNNELTRLARSIENLGGKLQQRELSIIEAQHNWQDTFDSVLEFITIVDPDFRLIQANRSFLQTYDLTLDEALGQKRTDLFSDNSRATLEEIYETVKRDKVIQHVSAFSERRKANFEMSFVPMLRDEGTLTGIIEVTRDVTEHRRLEGQLRQSQKMEAIGQLAGGIAHDFNNLLQIILGYADKLEADALSGQGDLAATQRIIDAGNRASDLTQRLLAFSRRQVIQTKPVNVDKIVRDSLDLVQRLIESNVIITYNPGETSAVINADANQMVQVLINLYVNARDAMPDGGEITISVSTDSVSELDPDRPCIQISVADTGVGIEETKQKQIFEPFFTSKKQGKGTGLGLAMAYGIVQQHQGEISVQSKVGEGSTFTILIPKYDGVEDPLQIDVETSVGVGREERVLVAEDDDGIRDLLSGVLEQAGYVVERAIDGNEALEKIQASGRQFDLVVLDIMMPGLSGTRVLEEARKIQPQLPCILASGYSDEAQRQAITTNKLTSFLSKPFRSESLLSEVRQLLDNN